MFLLQGCSDTPFRPTQLFESPKAFCPAPMTVPSLSGLPLTISYSAATATGGTPPTTVSCSPASGAMFPIGVTTVSCTATDKVARTDVCRFSVTVTAPPRLSVTRFLAFGDSLTWGEDGRHSVMTLGSAGSTPVRPRVQFPVSDTYPGALQAKLAALYTAQAPQVTNGGKPGETVTSSATFPRFVSFTSSGAYDVVLLMEGANDLGSHSNSEIIAGLARMVDDAKSRGMKVFLATLPPQNQAVTSFNDSVNGLAASKGVPLVDVYQAFGNNVSLIGNDGLHPTAAGYQVIANTFFVSIRQTLELPAAMSSAASRPTRPRTQAR
jgi:lysophospholipase L1-like esterase